MKLLPSEERIAAEFAKGKKLVTIASELDRSYDYIRQVMKTVRNKTGLSNHQIILAFNKGVQSA
jgi:DNA-binding CsgD family transcriptional regulator